MSTAYPILPSRPSVPHIATSCEQCDSQLEFLVPVPYPRPSTLLHIRCFNCQSVITHAFYPTQVQGTTGNGPINVGSQSNNGSKPSAGPSSSVRKGRKIGTQERPLETGYYDILGVPITATTDDVKKAYRELCRSLFRLRMSSDSHRSTRNQTSSRQES
jgi:hypothetical protein